MKKIILFIFFNLFFSTNLYSAVDSKKKEVLVSCNGTGDSSIGKFNWFDDYRFVFNPIYSVGQKNKNLNEKELFNDKNIEGYTLNIVVLENCSHCMGRQDAYASIDGNNDTLIISNNSIIIKQKGKTEIYTTISKSSGNFSSIDKIQYGQNIINRTGVCKNVDLLFLKIDEYKNLYKNKSTSKYFLKKIIE